VPGEPPILVSLDEFRVALNSRVEIVDGVAVEALEHPRGAAIAVDRRLVGRIVLGIEQAAAGLDGDVRVAREIIAKEVIVSEAGGIWWFQARS
jgi:hypothetical protein